MLGRRRPHSKARLLSDVSRLCMEHNHFIQQSRRRETADLVGRSKKLMDEVLNAIEKQNYYIYDETEQLEETAVDGSDFVDIDAVSEIVCPLQQTVAHHGCLKRLC